MKLKPHTTRYQATSSSASVPQRRFVLFLVQLPSLLRSPCGVPLSSGTERRARGDVTDVDAVTPAHVAIITAGFTPIITMPVAVTTAVTNHQPIHPHVIGIATAAVLIVIMAATIGTPAISMPPPPSPRVQVAGGVLVVFSSCPHHALPCGGAGGGGALASEQVRFLTVTTSQITASFPSPLDPSSSSFPRAMPMIACHIEVTNGNNSSLLHMTAMLISRSASFGDRGRMS